MYRCKVCGALSKPHEPLKVHVVTRDVSGPSRYSDVLGSFEQSTRTEISQEIPVCILCDTLLHSGHSLEWLTRLRRYQPKPIPTKDPVLQPLPPLHAKPVTPLGRTFMAKGKGVC